MTRLRTLALALLVACCLMESVATSDSSVDRASVQPTQTDPVVVGQESEQSVSTGAPLYKNDWWSVNGGGRTKLTGSVYYLGLTAAEPVNGFVSGKRYDMGFGFWYGSGLCPIALSGDVNLNGQVSTSDIVGLVNYVLKAGPEPLPCIANGDVNCNGSVSITDIVVLINKVLKGGPEPCDVCTMIPSSWDCL